LPALPQCEAAQPTEQRTGNIIKQVLVMACQTAFLH